MAPGSSSPPRAAAVVVAAGDSTRMRAGGGAVRKPWIELAGAPIVEHTLRALDAATRVSEVILVSHPEDVDRFERLAAEHPAYAKVRGVVRGGAQRADSVRRGVFWTSFEIDVVLVHDAARPLVEPALVDRAVDVARERGAALVALPVRDTIKQADAAGEVAETTLDRSRLWAAQTPQAFRARELRQLTGRAEEDRFLPTDDAALWEHYVGPVPLVEGSPDNFKITSPEDLVRAAAVLAARATPAEQP